MFVGRYVLASVFAIMALASGCKDEGTTKDRPGTSGFARRGLSDHQ